MKKIKLLWIMLEMVWNPWEHFLVMFADKQLICYYEFFSRNNPTVSHRDLLFFSPLSELSWYLYPHLKIKSENLDDNLDEKNSYRICIKVRWFRDSILQKKFWKFIRAHPRILLHTPEHLRTPTLIHAHPTHHTHTYWCLLMPLTW